MPITTSATPAINDATRRNRTPTYRHERASGTAEILRSVVWYRPYPVVLERQTAGLADAIAAGPAARDAGDTSAAESHLRLDGG
jgi:hypothetical protein